MNKYKTFKIGIGAAALGIAALATAYNTTDAKPQEPRPTLIQKFQNDVANGTPIYCVKPSEAFRNITQMVNTQLKPGEQAASTAEIKELASLYNPTRNVEIFNTKFEYCIPNRNNRQVVLGVDITKEEPKTLQYVQDRKAAADKEYNSKFDENGFRVKR